MCHHLCLEDVRDNVRGRQRAVVGPLQLVKQAELNCEPVVVDALLKVIRLGVQVVNIAILVFGDVVAVFRACRWNR